MGAVPKAVTLRRVEHYVGSFYDSVDFLVPKAVTLRRVEHGSP